MVTDVERDYLWSTYATDPRARINLGIRRRLASLMDNDRRKIELMNSLLMSLPGTPIIYYGDEIGMGDNIYLGDRNGVRTPMQWTPDRNGGFSRCDPARLYLPMIMDPVYGYEAVNVEAQSRSLASLLSWTKRLISVRKSSSVFGRGSLAFIRPANRAVLVYVRQYENEVLLCVANLSRSAQAAEIDLSPWRGRVPLEMLGRTSFPPIGEHPYVVTLAPYGFFWFQLCRADGCADRGAEHRAGVRDAGPGGLDVAGTGPRPPSLERDVLPAFLAGRRWFAERGSRSITAKVATAIPLLSADPGLTLAVIETSAKGGTAQYLLPLTIKWTRLDRDRRDPQALAAVRRGPREGALIDATAQTEFISLMLEKLQAGETIDGRDGRRLVFRPSPAFSDAGKSRGPRRSRGRYRAVEHDGARRQRLRRQAVSPARARRQSGDRGGPVPDRYGRVCEYAAALGHRRAGRRRGDAALSRRPRLRRKPGRRLDGDERLSRPLRRGAAPAHGRAAEDSDEQAAYLRGCGRSAGGSPKCSLRLRAATTLLISRPSRSPRRTSARWSDGVLQRAERVLDELARRRNEVTEADRPMVDSLLSYREALPAR